MTTTNPFTYEPDLTLPLADQMHFSAQLRLGAWCADELPTALSLGDANPWAAMPHGLGADDEGRRTAVAEYARWLLRVVTERAAQREESTR